MKIFQIGMNKTGTRSLHEALKILGYKSLHHGPEPFSSIDEHLLGARRIKNKIVDNIECGHRMLQGFEEFDAFSDIGIISLYYKRLDLEYPGSKFIYTDRDIDSWIDSRKRHVERNIMAVKDGRRKVQGFSSIDESSWRVNFARHRRAVFQYFDNRPEDFLVINICAGEGFEKLCPFLGHDEPTLDFPRRS